MERAAELGKSGVQAEQFRATGNGRRGRPAHRWFAGRGVVHQPVLPPPVACGNDSFSGRLATSAFAFISPRFSDSNDPHSRNYLQSNYVSAAVACLAVRNLLVGTGSGARPAGR